MVQMTEFPRASSYIEGRENSPVTDRSPPRYSPPAYSRPSSSRLSPFVGSYSNCNSIDELCNRFSRYHRQVRDMVNSFGNVQIDDETRDIINQVGNGTGQQPLKFHWIHGANVVLLKNQRMAKRQESFCKGLAFSNRPIEVDENVCLRLCEVGTNWSGVLRFGVTNENPEAYKDQPVPTFACPDLTTKDGYWAKALPERYSHEGNILHFYVNSGGELFYGINGLQKGMFLTGINVHRPMWLILDIYGNSVGVEIIDASDFRPRRSAPPPPSMPAPPRPLVAPPTLPAAPATSSTAVATASDSLAALPRSGDSEITPLRFHATKGRHITLNTLRNIATRDQAEYSQGYVFTERPIKSNEKVMITISQVQRMYEGGLAFGVTCSNPATIRPTDLPDDSNDLVNLPEYWVAIKDVAMQAKQNSVLAFWMTSSGEIKIELDNNIIRSNVHVDNQLDLYMFFDVYGSTTSIKMLGCVQMSRVPSPANREIRENLRNEQPMSIPRRPARISDTSTSSSTLAPTRNPPPIPQSPLRVNVRDSLESSSSAPSVLRPSVDDLMSMNSVPPPLAPRSTQSLATPTVPLRPSSVNSSQYSVAVPTVPAVPSVAAPAVASTVPQRSGSVPSDEDECTVCMDNPVNSVLYTCGHMCLCFDCGRRLLVTNGSCPICRALVKDVIRTYKS